MAIAGVNNGVVAIEKQVTTNNDSQPINFDNSTVIDGHGGGLIDNYTHYIDGYNLDVDYYSFVRGHNTENTLLDPKDISQQYILVKQLVLKVGSPLSNSSNYNDLTIDAVIDSNISPALNDLVSIMLPNGLVGLFKVSEVSKKTYISKGLYDITLSFYIFKKDNPDYYNNLLSKVTKTFVYDKSFMTTNSAPILTEETYKKKVNMNTIFNQLLTEYIDMFTYEKVLSYLDNDTRYFDGNIQNLVVSLMDSSKYSNLNIVETMYNNKNVVNTLINKSNDITRVGKLYQFNPVEYNIANSESISLLSGMVDLSLIVNKNIELETVEYMTKDDILAFIKDNTKDPCIYTNLRPSTAGAGGVEEGEIFEGESIQDMFDRIFYPDDPPTIVEPSVKFTINLPSLVEVGVRYNGIFTTIFDYGSITNTTGNIALRAGDVTSYEYDGIFLPEIVESNKGSNIINMEVVFDNPGTGTWSSTVNFNEGAQPNSSNGNPVGTPLPAGSITSEEITIHAVYPFYATTLLIDELTKQPLSNDDYITVLLAKEENDHKQRFQIPATVGPLKGVEFFNIITQKWEWLSGSKERSVLLFEETETDYHGVLYYEYKNKSSTIGAREVRLYIK